MFSVVLTALSGSRLITPTAVPSPARAAVTLSAPVGVPPVVNDGLLSVVDPSSVPPANGLNSSKYCPVGSTTVSGPGVTIAPVTAYGAAPGRPTVTAFG